MKNMVPNTEYHYKQNTCCVSVELGRYHFELRKILLNVYYCFICKISTEACYFLRLNFPYGTAAYTEFFVSEKTLHCPPPTKTKVASVSAVGFSVVYSRRMLDDSLQ